MSDCLLDADELVPEDGKDKVYDEIMEEIRELEDELDRELKKFEKKVGCVDLWLRGSIQCLTTQ